MKTPALILSIIALLAGATGEPAAAHDLAQPAADTEVWTGTLEVPGASLRLELHVTTNDDGTVTAQLFSLDQTDQAIPVNRVSVADGMLTFSVDVIAGSYEGTLNAAGDVATGAWSQSGMSLPLQLTRQPPAP